MAHSLSAKKRVRQNLVRRARNRGRKLAIKDEVKAFMTVLGSGDLGKADAALNKVTRELDRVAAKHTIHKNTASRKRSRLARMLNAAKAGKSGGGAAAPAAKA